MPKRRPPVLDRRAGSNPNQTQLRNLGAFASIWFLTLAAYLPALTGILVWDDARHVTRPDLRSLHGLWRIWFELGATQQYYPLLHSAFWLEHSIWGDSVLGYHLLNVALHAAAACLVVKIARRLELPGAWFAGACFAVHPMLVESVAWISEQKSTLSGFFYLAAALVYLDFDESRRPSRYWAASGLFVLALMSKTVTATLPAALLVVLWWRRGTLAWKRDTRPLLPWFAMGAAAGLFTAWVERTMVGASGADFTLSPVQRVLVAGRVVWFYAAKLLWPAELTFVYPHWRVNAGEWWQYLFPAGAVAVGAGLWLLARRHRGPLAGFLVFVGTLFPVLGFFNVYPFRYSYVADHFSYLASLGILVPAASALSIGAAKFGRSKTVEVIVPAILLAAMGVLTWRQAAIYRDDETLFRATIASNPDAWLAHDNLGNILFRNPGRRAEAVAHFEAALRANPDYWEAHLSMGNALLETPGRLDGAVAEYQTAVRLAPEAERAHTNLGNAFLRAGQTQEAIAQFEFALRIQPASAAARSDLANALTRIPGRLPDAIAEYQAAVHAKPDFAEAHNDLGHVLALVPGRMPEAIAQFEEAIRIRPDYWGAHSNLGTALSQIPGRLADAIAEYETASRLRPDLAKSHSDLGNALSRMPDRLPDAIAEYRRALELDSEDADAHYNLACLLIRMPGGQAESLAESEAALRLKPSPQLQQIVERLRAWTKAQSPRP
ncbi:MAG: tetratricopeptide repeat protein [Bryobacteraceae bacterium]|jgi:tetratricopeptide (TPR) repeat protein